MNQLQVDRLEYEEMEHGELVETLGERDDTIAELRAMLDRANRDIANARVLTESLLQYDPARGSPPGRVALSAEDVHAISGRVMWLDEHIAEIEKADDGRRPHRLRQERAALASVLEQVQVKP